MLEIERKFLLKKVPSYIRGMPCSCIVQGYISKEPIVRIRKIDEKYMLTIKLEQTKFIRDEFEISISKNLYEKLLNLVTSQIIIKRRYYIELSPNTIAELDIFDNPDGLKIVEVEFPHLDDAVSFIPPDWFGSEVTTQESYSNVNLAYI